KPPKLLFYRLKHLFSDQHPAYLILRPLQYCFQSSRNAFLQYSQTHFPIANALVIYNVHANQKLNVLVVVLILLRELKPVCDWYELFAMLLHRYRPRQDNPNREPLKSRIRWYPLLSGILLKFQKYFLWWFDGVHELKFRTYHPKHSLPWVLVTHRQH